MSKQRVSRRRFIAQSSAALGLIPLISITNEALGQAPNLVEESSPTAIALGYKHNANEVDRSRYPQVGTPEENRICLTCTLYTDVTATEQGPCSLFPSNTVSAQGWCSVWQQRPG